MADSKGQKIFALNMCIESSKKFKMSEIALTIFLLVFCSNISIAENLKILTINVWYGLDYVGVISMSELETAEHREARFNSLLIQLREQNADVIYLQEVNPTSSYTKRLADSLDYDYIYQICNTGVKIFGFGFPSNLDEGIAILARKNLNLKEYKVLKLNGFLGIYSDNFSLHFDEVNFAIIGKINISDLPVYLINTHLTASPPPDSALIARYKIIAKQKGAEKIEIDEAVRQIYSKCFKRKENFDEIIDFTKDLPDNSAVILGGDFNAIPNSYEILSIPKSIFFDSQINKIHSYTWLPEGNDNIVKSSPDNTKNKNFGYTFLDALGNDIPQTLDYIFLSSSAFRKNNILSSEIVLNKRINGILPSDHFGYAVEVSLDSAFKLSPKETKYISPFDRVIVDPIPIASYDYDTGLGLGAKVLLLNALRKNESFDLTVFGSTKGEIWTRFVFSMPHYELRQRKIYPISMDFVFDFDKFLEYSYFGVGNLSKFEDREIYTKEVLQFNLNFSRGITEYIVANAGLQFKNIRNYNIKSSGNLKNLGGKNLSTVDYTSVFANFRYDSRNSFINPSSGFLAQFESEYSPNLSFNNVAFARFGLAIHEYLKLFYPTTVLATRIKVQSLVGDNLPIQVLLPIGGNNTLRGFPQDRFLDMASALFNIELRFPIVWRIGGVAGIDAGKVWHSISKIDLNRWSSNYVIGLRGILDTYIIRADFGVSKETTGIYLNFEHIF